MRASVVTDEDRAAYRAKITAGGCQVWNCAEQADARFSVWWKCPEGHREEFRYCREDGPERLEDSIARAAVILCECGEWMRPIVEGLIW